MRSPGNREAAMAMLTIRNLDPAIKERLRVRAAQHGRSMEAEARAIFQTVLNAPKRPPERNLYERIRARFAPLGGVDLDLPPRQPTRDPPRFG
jgi:plasmid stability protein